MESELIRKLWLSAKILRHQIGTGQCGQVETQRHMEALIRIIRDKKCGGRGEAAGQGRPPTPTMAEKNRACGPTQPSRFVTDAITGGHGFRIVTENGPHRSQFERDSE